MTQWVVVVLRACGSSKAHRAWGGGLLAVGLNLFVRDFGMFFSCSSFFNSLVIFLSVALVRSFEIFRYTGSSNRFLIFLYSDWSITIVSLPLSAVKIARSDLSRRLLTAVRSGLVTLGAGGLAFFRIYTLFL